MHTGGTYVCMEGPQFSTLAESQLYRSWGMDIIGMTNLQEAKLAREAEICYTTIALVTDYDCWHPEHDQVTVEMIIANLTQNARTAQQVIADAVGRLPFDAPASAPRAEVRDHHPARRHAGGDEAGAGAACGEISTRASASRFALPAGIAAGRRATARRRRQ